MKKDYRQWNNKRLGKEIDKIEKKKKRKAVKGHRNHNKIECDPYKPEYRQKGLIL